MPTEQGTLAGSKLDQPGTGTLTGDKANDWGRRECSVIGQWAVICLLMLAPGTLWTVASILDALNKRLRPAGVRLMAVSVDGPGTEETILRFGDRLGLRLDLMHDASGEIVRSFQAIGIPTTAVVDRDGRLIRIMRGANGVLDGSLERLLDSLIQKSRSTDRLLR